MIISGKKVNRMIAEARDDGYSKGYVAGDRYARTEGYQDAMKIAVAVEAAMSACCGCSIDGWDAEQYLKAVLTEDEHSALLAAIKKAQERQ